MDIPAQSDIAAECSVYMNKGTVDGVSVTTCRQYCSAYGLSCVAQYEDDNGCNRREQYASCDESGGDTSDHICVCTGKHTIIIGISASPTAVGDAENSQQVVLAQAATISASAQVSLLFSHVWLSTCLCMHTEAHKCAGTAATSAQPGRRF